MECKPCPEVRCPSELQAAAAAAIVGTAPDLFSGRWCEMRRDSRASEKLGQDEVQRHN